MNKYTEFLSEYRNLISRRLKSFNYRDNSDTLKNTI